MLPVNSLPLSIHNCLGLAPHHDDSQSFHFSPHRFHEAVKFLILQPFPYLTDAYFVFSFFHYYLIQFVGTFETGRMRRIKVNCFQIFFPCRHCLCSRSLSSSFRSHPSWTLRCLQGIMSHARLSGSDGRDEFMSTDNLFLTLGEGKMFPNDKDNKLIHNSGG